MTDKSKYKKDFSMHDNKAELQITQRKGTKKWNIKYRDKKTLQLVKYKNTCLLRKSIK